MKFGRRKGDNPAEDSWVQTHDKHAIKIVLGEHYVGNIQEEAIAISLGASVAACMRDPVTKVGGMTAFLLPDDPAVSLHNASVGARYGTHVMENLIDAILQRGGQRARLEVSIFGGGNLVSDKALIGARNAAFLKDYIKESGMRLISEDVGDTYPRHLHFYPYSGRVSLIKLQRSEDISIIEAEREFSRRIST